MVSAVFTSSSIFFSASVASCVGSEGKFSELRRILFISSAFGTGAGAISSSLDYLVQFFSFLS
jgi:hypothetical protein